MRKLFLTIGVLIAVLIILTGCNEKTEKSGEFKIVSSFYPMYILTKNIAEDIDGVEVYNMADKMVGCMHNYTLTTSDLVKLETANALITNGLGIENFIDKVTETYSKINIITASKGITELLIDEHDGESSEANAHVWLSINKYLAEIENVKNGLIEIDNSHRNEYEKNAERYKEKITELKAKIDNQNLERKKCISFSEALAYLSEDFNLEIFTIETDHEHNGLSAETMKSIIDYVKTNNIKNILIDSSTADNNAKTVANETGAKIYLMNSALSGEKNNDEYIKAMEENLKLVESME